MRNKNYILRKISLFKPELKELGIKDIGLFGSYARNEQNDKSDLDIIVEFYPEMENFDNYMSVYDLLEDLFKNVKIEVITKKGLSPHIGPEILKETIYA